MVRYASAPQMPACIMTKNQHALQKLYHDREEKLHRSVLRQALHDTMTKNQHAKIINMQRYHDKKSTCKDIMTKSQHALKKSNKNVGWKIENTRLLRRGRKNSTADDHKKLAELFFKMLIAPAGGFCTTCRNQPTNQQANA